MNAGDLPEVIAAQALFWILLPFVFFASPRWAVLAWLLMGNLDATGPSQAASAVGWINAAKGVALPLVLWWRLGRTPSAILHSLPARFWMALAAYASVAVLWSPSPLLAWKLVGNMIGILVALVALEKASRAGFLDSRILIALVLISLSLGVVQTYYYGGAAYGSDGPDQPSRFSSFIAAQQYAAFLVAFLSILLWRRSMRLLTRVALCGATGLALVLNGSRVWFFGAVLALLIYWWQFSRRFLAVASFSIAASALFTILVINLGSLDGFAPSDSSNRIVATATALITGTDTSRNVGLRDLNFRSRLYDGILTDLRTSGLRELVFGHGTSSGGSAAISAFPSLYKADYIDSNRTIHNEWLRALYEWGVCGLLLLVGALGSLVIGLIQGRRDSRWRANSLPLLCFLPAFLAAFSTENVLAGAGNGVTMSLALVVSLMWSPALATRQSPRSTFA